MAGDRRTLRTSVPAALFYELAHRADAEELPLGEVACRVLEEAVPGWREMPPQPSHVRAPERSRSDRACRLRTAGQHAHPFR